MYMFMRTWCWPGTTVAGPPGPSSMCAWSSAAIDVGLLQRAGLLDSCGPQPQAAIEAGAAEPAGERGRAGIERVVLRRQPAAEGVGDVLVVVEAAVQPLDVGGRDDVQHVLVEVGTDQLSSAVGEAGRVQLLEEGHESGRHGHVEHHVGPAGDDPLDHCAVVGVVEREVLLTEHAATVGGDHLMHACIHHARPHVVGGGQVEGLCPCLFHQPRHQCVDLLRRDRPGAEDQRIGFLAFVLLGVDVERLAFGHRWLLDRLPGRAEDPAEDDVDAVLVDQLLRRGRGDRVVGGAILDVELECPAQQPALGVDIADHHAGDVCVCDTGRLERPALVGNHSHPDRVGA